MNAANSALEHELDVRRHSVLALGASSLALVKFDEKKVFGVDREIKIPKNYLGHEV